MKRKAASATLVATILVSGSGCGSEAPHVTGTSRQGASNQSPESRQDDALLKGTIPCDLLGPVDFMRSFRPYYDVRFSVLQVEGYNPASPPIVEVNQGRNCTFTGVIRASLSANPNDPLPTLTILMTSQIDDEKGELWSAKATGSRTLARNIVRDSVQTVGRRNRLVVTLWSHDDAKGLLEGKSGDEIMRKLMEAALGNARGV